MATKALNRTPEAKTITIKPGTNIVSLQELMKQQVMGLAERTAPPGGDKIRVTQDKMFKLPDGRTSPGPIRMVVVDFIAANNFYKGNFDPKNIQPPVCFAIGTNPTTLVPSDNSPEKQAEKCSVCPMNQFGSAGDGKACKNGRLLAVLPPDATEETPLMLLQVSPTALKGFDGYVKSVAQQFQLPPVGVTTDVSFDPNQTYASLLFSKPEPNNNLALFVTRQAEARTRLMTEPDVSRVDAPAPTRKVARQ